MSMPISVNLCYILFVCICVPPTICRHTNLLFCSFSRLRCCCAFPPPLTLLPISSTCPFCWSPVPRLIIPSGTRDEENRRLGGNLCEERGTRMWTSNAGFNSNTYSPGHKSAALNLLPGKIYAHFMPPNDQRI
jgi:hypothetical protein